MNRTSGAVGPLRSIRSISTDRSPPSGLRVLAVAIGGLLVGSYLRVFYHVVDVAGGVRWLAIGVSAAVVLATIFARVSTVRTGVLVGAILVTAGVAIYVVFVPAIHDELLSVTFARKWLRYLTGVSVLGFRRVDLWAVVVAPGPTFLSCLLLLRRRYDGAALVGGLMLGFFTLTGDATQTTTLVGMTSVLGLLGVGSVERGTGTWREATQVGLVVATAAIVARSIRLVPESGALASGDAGGSDPTLGNSLGGDLDNADERARIHESISLSPVVQFTIEADAGAYWHVATYDRYTGSDWIRTGDAAPYDGPLDPPPGETTRNEQTIQAERTVRTLPAAWKPIEVSGVQQERVRVTDLGGLVPVDPLEPADGYRVTSEMPRKREPTRDAGEDASAAVPAAVRDRYLQYPESTPDRVREFAERIAGDATTAYDAAVAIRQWLVVNKSYDVDVDAPPDDLVEGFLSSMDGGYCVYFASAMALMLRTLDVPARFVLGYTTGQRVGDGRWVVRGLDSHAWVEIYQPGTGWIPFDPTPRNFRDVIRRAVLGRARQRGVVGVDTDESRRASTLGEVDRIDATGGDFPDGENATTAASERANATEVERGSAATGGTETPIRADAPDDPVARWLTERDRLDLLAGAVGVALGLHWVGALERGYRSVQLRWQRRTGSPRRDVDLAYERLEILLGRRFRPRRPTETRRRYVELAEGIVDDARARRVVELFERAIYAGEISRSEADEAIQLVDELVDGDR